MCTSEETRRRWAARVCQLDGWSRELRDRAAQQLDSPSPGAELVFTGTRDILSFAAYQVRGRLSNGVKVANRSSTNSCSGWLVVGRMLLFDVHTAVLERPLDPFPGSSIRGSAASTNSMIIVSVSAV